MKLQDDHPAQVATAVEPSNSILSKYREFSDVFYKQNEDRLPGRCLSSLWAHLRVTWAKSGCVPCINQRKRGERVHLALKISVHGTNPIVKKKDGSFHLCVNYRGLNKVAIRNCYPLPLILELLDRLRLRRVFSKIDLQGAYNLVRIRPRDEWKTMFQARYGLFEYRVMPFGLTNAPTVFQHMMNDIFCEYLDQFMVVYLDDILIFSPDLDINNHDVCHVLSRLREDSVYAKYEKCAFKQSFVEFLGYIISPDSISMDQRKVVAIQELQPLTQLRDIQSFLGFANFYRRFIKGVSNFVQPLVALSHKDQPFCWMLAEQNAFLALQSSFMSARVLPHPDPTMSFIVETNALDFAIGAIISQPNNDGVHHPVAYYSRKFTALEINYLIYGDKDL